MTEGTAPSTHHLHTVACAEQRIRRLCSPNLLIAESPDPTDDKFLELAVNGRADLIVGGDADLLALDPFRGIPIVTPAGFLQRTEQ